MELEDFIKQPQIKELNPFELRLLIDLISMSSEKEVHFNILKYTKKSTIKSRLTCYKILDSLETKGLIQRNKKKVKIILDF